MAPRTHESSSSDFGERIRRTLLKKSSTHPLMRAAPAVGKADVEKEDMLDIVAKSTQVRTALFDQSVARF